MPTAPTPLSDFLRAQAHHQARDAARAEFPQCGGEVRPTALTWPGDPWTFAKRQHADWAAERARKDAERIASKASGIRLLGTVGP